jgi:hypothetical protein
MMHSMLRNLFLTVSTGFILLGLQAGGSQADDFKVEEGYTSLFNGKDLTGWRLGKMNLDGQTESPNKKWHVTDGAIVIDGGGAGDLYTVASFNKDFHLKLEFRAAPRADSGLFIRGPQLQVRDYPTVGPYKKVKFNDAGWNELDVTVKSGVPTTTVNGKTLTDKDVLELTVKEGRPAAKLNGQAIDISNITVSVGAVALCKCNGEVIEPAFKVGATGGIGLQSETGKFEFRRLRIKEGH